MNSRINSAFGQKWTCIIPDNLAFVTDVTGTVEIYTLFQGTYVGMDWSPLVWSLVLEFGNRSCLVCVLFLDLPSLHVSHFGTKCFYTCIIMRYY